MFKAGEGGEYLDALAPMYDLKSYEQKESLWWLKKLL